MHDNEDAILLFSHEIENISLIKTMFPWIRKKFQQIRLPINEYRWKEIALTDLHPRLKKWPNNQDEKYYKLVKVLFDVLFELSYWWVENDLDCEFMKSEWRITTKKHLFEFDNLVLSDSNRLLFVDTFDIHRHEWLLEHGKSIKFAISETEDDKKLEWARIVSGNLSPSSFMQLLNYNNILNDSKNLAEQFFSFRHPNNVVYHVYETVLRLKWEGYAINFYCHCLEQIKEKYIVAYFFNEIFFHIMNNNERLAEEYWEKFELIKSYFDKFHVSLENSICDSVSWYFRKQPKEQIASAKNQLHFLKWLWIYI